jgi:hypothetical protein
MNQPKPPKPGAQILIYHGKYGDEYWLVDTPARLEAAQRNLFSRLDEWHCYEDDEEHITQARAGDIKAIRWMLDTHQTYEYERWNIEEAFDPCTD